jgi:DNA-binding NarL/FixJ family response regulator
MQGDEPTTITPRMLEVLRAVAVADSQRTAAHSLGVAYETVHGTMATLRRRLGVATTTQALIRVGWLRLPDR